MNTFKKLAAITLAAAMIFTLVGCSPANTDTTAATTAATTAGAEPTTAAPAENGKIVVGTSADFAPYEFHKIINGTDTILGSDIELAKQIALDMGKELEIVDMNFDLLLTQVNEGTVDFVVACINANPERLEQVDFSDVYYKSNHVVLIKKDKVDTLTGYEAFKGLTLAAQSGSVQEGHLAKYFADSNHIVVKKVPDEVAQLMQGKVDGVILDEDVAQGYAKQHEDLVVANFVVEEAEGAAVAVKKGNSELIEQINKTIKKIKDEGKYSQWITDAAEQAAE